jgi:predicted DNA-binding antitoxin AbrB/MazE fold protein
MLPKYELKLMRDNIYLNRTHPVSNMSGAYDKEIEAIYENGVFKPVKKVKLREGTRALVIIKPGRILEIARRHRIKVENDVLEEFVEERR